MNFQSWSKTARRARVPVGFAFAAFYLWRARPSTASLLWSLVLVLPGLLLRAYASGYVKKNTELTVTGPYAHTRNPLYLGSMMVAFGFAAAALSLWITLLLAILFTLVYVPTIREEERFLRAAFPAFAAYARRVPRLLPRLVAERSGGAATPRFSGVLYRQHREYNALLGALGIYAALVVRLLLRHRC